jgi:hypothetical protein
MFGFKKTVSPQDTGGGKVTGVTIGDRTTIIPVPIDEKERLHQQIEDLAKALEPEVLAKAPSFLAEAQLEHMSDCQTYSFECRRWGDFLSLYVQRVLFIGHYDNGVYRQEYKLEKFTTSVNIRESEIRLVEGHGPDELGCVKYYRSNYNYSTYTTDTELRVIAMYPTIPRRDIFKSVTCGKYDNTYRGSYYEPQRYDPELKTSYPRAAQDDEIRFIPSGATLYVPVGLGAMVNETILREIGDFMNR